MTSDVITFPRQPVCTQTASQWFSKIFCGPVTVTRVRLNSVSRLALSSLAADLEIEELRAVQKLRTAERLFISEKPGVVDGIRWHERCADLMAGVRAVIQRAGDEEIELPARVIAEARGRFGDGFFDKAEKLMAAGG